MSTPMDTIEKMRNHEATPVVIVDETGAIIFTNNAFTSSFGWNQEEALGQDITIIIPEELHEAHHMGFSRFIDSEEAKIMHTPLNLKACNRAGEVFDAEHYIIGEKIGGRWQIASTVKPL